MNKRKRRNKSVERDNNNIASNILLHSTIRSVLSDISDRRTFHPLGDVRPAKGFSKGASRVVLSPNVNRSSKNVRARPDVFRFNSPGSVAVCVRRQKRREVIFALRKSGKGARSRRRRNYFSDVSCSR